MKHRLPWLLWGFVLLVQMALDLFAFSPLLDQLGAGIPALGLLLFIDCVGIGSWITAWYLDRLAIPVSFGKAILLAWLVLTSFFVFCYQFLAWGTTLVGVLKGQ